MLTLFSSFCTLKKKSELRFFILFFLVFTQGCYVTHNLNYFRTLSKDTLINNIKADNTESKIVIGDILSINVSSLNSELDERFNSAFKDVGKSTNAEFQPSPGVKVDENGQIFLHFLGKTNVAGLSKTELKEKLEKDLSSYLKDPIVNVHYANRKITVFGQVGSPKLLYFDNEVLPIFDALVMSGDLAENADIKDVMIIRDSSDVKMVRHLNLQDHSIFSTTWYYLRPNDNLYVKKDMDSANRSEKLRNFQTTLSLIASGFSLVIIILNNLIK